MILDTSALVAILKDEPAKSALTGAIEAAPVCYISAANLLELFIVVARAAHRDLGARADELLRLIEPAVEPVTEAQARIAQDAFLRYGKGMGHPAQLNFGDCFAYALARDRNERATTEGRPYLGEDFARTDIRPAIALP